MRNLLIESIGTLKEIAKKCAEESKVSKKALDLIKDEKLQNETINQSLRAENEILNEKNRKIKEDNEKLIEINQKERKQGEKDLSECLVRLEKIKNDIIQAEKNNTKHKATIEQIEELDCKREELSVKILIEEDRLKEIIKTNNDKEKLLDKKIKKIADKEKIQKDIYKEQLESSIALEDRNKSLNKYSKALEKSVNQLRNGL